MNTYKSLQESLASSLALAAKNDIDHIKLEFDQVKHLVESLERIYYEGALAGAIDSEVRQEALKYFEDNNV